MRIALTFVFFAFSSPSFAHGVHAAVEEGHSHWVAPVALAVAAVLAVAVGSGLRRL